MGLNSLSLSFFTSALVIAGACAQGASAAERVPVAEEPPANVEMTPLPDVEPPMDIKPEDAPALERFQLPPPPQTSNHYTCYRVKQVQPIQPRVVVLRDQFGARKVKVMEIIRLCSPTIKYTGQQIFKPSDPRLHLVCYRISETKPVNRIAFVANQFGRAILRVYDNNELCLPSSKRLFR